MPTIIAHTQQYPPYRRIGAELATHELLRYLAAAGWDAIVRPARDMRHPYELDGVLVTPEPVGELPIPDVVLHGAAHWHLAQAHARGMDAVQVMWAHGGWASWLVAQIQSAAPDLALLNSDSMRRGIAPLIHHSELMVLRPPVPAYIGPLVTRADPRAGSITLINTAENKGGPLFRELALAMPELHFLGVRGGYGDQLDGPVPENLTLLEHGQWPMERVYASTSVLLVPSRDESWSMVAVEAMQRGIPVIGMAVPGLMECLGYVGDDHGPNAMPAVSLTSEVDVWKALLTSVLANWQTWHERALRRAAELDPLPGLVAVAERLERMVG